MKHLTLDPSHAQPPTRDLPTEATVPDSLPDPKERKVHPKHAGGENARLLFVGTATTILYVVHFAEVFSFFFFLFFIFFWDVVWFGSWRGGGDGEGYYDLRIVSYWLLGLENGRV